MQFYYPFVITIYCYIFLVVTSKGLVWDDIILPPHPGKKGSESVLYFAQGADLKTSQYVKLMEFIQKKLPFPLWVGIPQCLNNVCSIPNTLNKGIERIKQVIIIIIIKN